MGTVFLVVIWFVIGLPMALFYLFITGSIGAPAAPSVFFWGTVLGPALLFFCFFFLPFRIIPQHGGKSRGVLLEVIPEARGLYQGFFWVVFSVVFYPAFANLASLGASWLGYSEIATLLFEYRFISFPVMWGLVILCLVGVIFVGAYDSITRKLSCNSSPHNGRATS